MSNATNKRIPAHEHEGYLALLRDHALNARVYGHVTHIHIEVIEPDQRKHSRVARELLAAGLLAPRVGEEHCDVTDAVYDGIEAVKPNIAAYRHRTRGHVAFSNLKHAERKYVIEHPEEFTVTVRDYHQGSRYYESPEQWDATSFPFEFGQSIQDALDKTVPHDSDLRYDNKPGASVRSYGYKVYVATDESIAIATDGHRQSRIKRVFRENLPWALEKFARVSKDDAKRWHANNPTQHGFPGGSVYAHLGDDPEAWALKAHEAAEKARARVQEALADLEAIQRVVGAVKGAGGWKAIAEKLHEGATEAVDNPEKAAANDAADERSAS